MAHVILSEVSVVGTFVLLVRYDATSESRFIVKAGTGSAPYEPFSLTLV